MEAAHNCRLPRVRIPVLYQLSFQLGLCTNRRTSIVDSCPTNSGVSFSGAIPEGMRQGSHWKMDLIPIHPDTLLLGMEKSSSTGPPFCRERANFTNHRLHPITFSALTVPLRYIRFNLTLTSFTDHPSILAVSSLDSVTR